MGMAVAVVPRLLVAIIPAGRNQAIEELRQIFLKARLEFDGSQRRGAPHSKDVDNPGLNGRLLDNFSYRLGQIVHVSVAASPNGNLFLKHHAFLHLLFLE
jgi:hypothetical protein